MTQTSSSLTPQPDLRGAVSMDDKAQSNTTVLAAFYVTVQHINSSVRRLVCHHCTRVTELNIDRFLFLEEKKSIF